MNESSKMYEEVQGLLITDRPVRPDLRTERKCSGNCTGQAAVPADKNVVNYLGAHSGCD